MDRFVSTPAGLAAGLSDPYPVGAAAERQVPAMNRAILLVAASLCAASAAARAAPCPPTGYDRARLEEVRAAGFEIADPAERRRFALALPACLSSPDAFLRDRIAFEALAHMLRARQLDAATQAALFKDVSPRLASADPNGFEAPFAALVLSELIRADRIDPYLKSKQRAAALDGALAYFVGVRDYRGFDESEGWRHGVAHGADLLMQIALNEATKRADLVRIRDGVSAQISPPAHFYVYGEAERLARPVLVIAQRNAFSAEDWQAWLAGVSAPAPLASWDAAFATQAGLAHKHNVSAFLHVIWANASLSKNEGVRSLLPGAEAALRALP